MRILMVTQYYWPENSRVTDIAKALKQAGNEVTVLTGLPNYPVGRIFDDYKHGKNREQIHDGVHIVRAKLFARGRSTLRRILNYYSFPFFGVKKARELPNNFDVVLAVEESPIFLVKPAIAYAKKNKKKLVMYEMDLWPESLLAGGVKKGSLIYNHYKRVSAKLYSKFDKILVSTKEHSTYIKALPGCSGLSIDYLPQYAEPIFEEQDFDSVDNGVLDLVFAGNVGKAQSIATLIRAASLLRDRPEFVFHIVGGGSALQDAKELAKTLKVNNVFFYGSLPLEEMPKFYKLADAMLVSLEDAPYANLTIPGKVQSYLAAGKPLVGSVNGACAALIKDNDVGLVCPAEDHDSLANRIRELNLKKLKTMAANAKALYRRIFSRESFYKTLLEVLGEHQS